MAHARATLSSLIADLIVRKATAAMHQTDHVLVPSSTRPDSFRVASLVEVIAAIPEDMYEEWGLPLGCRLYIQEVRKERRLNGIDETQLVDSETQDAYPSDTFILARNLTHPYWVESPERKVFEPIFIFVYGLNIEKMDRRDPDDLSDFETSLGDSGGERNPWSAKHIQRQWQAPRRNMYPSM
ncbi:MAG: hypothetical protein Q9173_001337 [Seirophora scorigena]